jgi:hypothetical protein
MRPRKARIALIFSVFLIVLTVSFPKGVTAGPLNTRCLCTPDSFMNRWHKANAVFTGTVTNIKEMKDYTRRGDETAVEVTLHVDEAFKNANADQDFVLYSSLPKYSCRGFGFEKGRRYLVYAYMREPQVFEYWSAYDFPSGTYGSGGVCGGIKTMDDKRTAPEIDSIRKDLKENPPPKGLLGKIINAGKIVKEERAMEDE